MPDNSQNQASRDDYYDVLGVTQDATADDIKAKYREIARKWHPDKHPGNEVIADKFKRVTTAYNVLSNADTRAAYDFERASVFQRSTFYPHPPSGAVGVVEYMRAVEDLLNNLGRKRRPVAPPQPPPNKPAPPAEDPIARARRAKTKTKKPAATPPEPLHITFRQAVLGGRVDGTLSTGEAFTTEIPQGVDDGETITIPVLMTTRTPNERRNPTYAGYEQTFLVHVEDDPHFERDGLDLRVRVPITVKEAFFGARIKISTIRRNVYVKLPPERYDTWMRLRALGIKRVDPVTNEEVFGDLFVGFSIVLPKSDEVEDAIALTHVIEDLAIIEAYTNPREAMFGPDESEDD